MDMTSKQRPSTSFRVVSTMDVCFPNHTMGHPINLNKKVKKQEQKSNNYPNWDTMSKKCGNANGIV